MTATVTVLRGRQPPGEDTMELAALAIADGLTDHDFDVRSPEWEGSHLLKITNARGLLPEILIGDSGSVEWECRPCDSHQADQASTAEMVRRILGGDPVAQAGEALAGRFSFKSVVGRMLADNGMAVSVKTYVDDYFFEAYSEIDVVNPARPDRGSACVADDGLVRWQCRIRKQPGDNRALDPGEIAAIIARALSGKDDA